jgi:hypothetical protein
MKVYIKLLLTGLILISCKTGKLKVLADISTSLNEVSAIEKTSHSEMLWVIQDAGNNNHLYGLNLKGQIIKDITIKNAKNTDWEDLTSDAEGNIYIGDFGNNSKKRTQFTIYKVPQPDTNSNTVEAEQINFTLPEDMESSDFEAFFLYDGFFYVFSKDNKTSELIKIPNQIGNHVASYVSKIKLKGKRLKVTSADISDDGTTIVLLNHDKLWKLTNYSGDDFFSGDLDAFSFEHNSQKEGIHLIHNNEVLITDERNKYDGGYIYRFNFK